MTEESKLELMQELLIDIRQEMWGGLDLLNALDKLIDMYGEKLSAIKRGRV